MPGLEYSFCGCWLSPFLSHGHRESLLSAVAHAHSARSTQSPRRAHRGPRSRGCVTCIPPAPGTHSIAGSAPTTRETHGALGCGAGGAGSSQQGSLQTPLKEDEKTGALRRHSALSPWRVSPLSGRRRENTRHSITVLKSNHNKSAKIHFAPCLCLDFREAHLSALKWQQLPQNLINQRCQVLN